LTNLTATLTKSSNFQPLSKFDHCGILKFLIQGIQGILKKNFKVGLREILNLLILGILLKLCKKIKRSFTEANEIFHQKLLSQFVKFCFISFRK
jgi:hypothetical protein